VREASGVLGFLISVQVNNLRLVAGNNGLQVFGPPGQRGFLLIEVIVPVMHLGDIGEGVIQNLLDMEPGHADAGHHARRGTAQIVGRKVRDFSMRDIVAHGAGKDSL
jgi:hypothetical protein